MKKHLLMLFLVNFTIIAFGQTSILNGNFEQWASCTYDSLNNYYSPHNNHLFFRYNLPFNVTKTTDAYHGNYAVQLTNIATPNVLSWGNFSNNNNINLYPNTWIGGVPYSQKPTGIRGYYKFNVATADSATIVVTFSKAGTNIGAYIQKFGGVHDTYTLFQFTFNPALTVTPDSMSFIAISSSKMPFYSQPQLPNASTDSILRLDTLKIDSVSFTGVSSQPEMMKGDFESWNSTTLYKPNNWCTNNDGNGFSRSTDAEDGNYAMELKTFQVTNNGQSTAHPGFISTGYSPYNCGSNIGGYPFTNKIDTLILYYKYSPSGIDTAYISLNFKKGGSSIGIRGTTFLTSASYKYIEIPINLTQTPDTVIVDIGSSLWSDNNVSFVGSDLIIDNIYFKSQLLTGIHQITFENGNRISIFPNPSTGKFQIKSLGSVIQKLEIFDVFGKAIYSNTKLYQQESNEIDMSQTQKGIYFVKIYDGVRTYSKKIVLK